MDAVQACINRCCPPCGGGCCSPAIVTGSLILPADATGLIVNIEGVCFEGVDTVEIRNPPTGGGPTALPTVTNVGDPVIGTIPTLDSIAVTLDTPPLDGSFSLVLINECGCCAIMTGQVQLA